MVIPLTPEAILLALLIGFLRFLNNGLFTVRMVLVTRGRKGVSFFLSFIEALLFAVTIAYVAADLTNLLNLFAYCFGFALGSLMGMEIESRFITSYMTINVVAKSNGHAIAMALREAGFGVTETQGEGRDGAVTMLRSIVVKRDTPRALQIIREQNGSAFVAVEEARAVHRGWLRAARPMQ